MIDPIKIAQQKVKLTDLIKTAETSNNQIIANRARAALNNLNVSDKVNLHDKLETVKTLQPITQTNIEMVKKEAVAAAHTAKANADALLQKSKETDLSNLRNRVESSISQLLSKGGLFPKLPLRDPKVLAHLAYMQAKEKIRELKQKTSKENLKKSKEVYTFPMKPPIRIDLGQIPRVEVPKIPEIPNITNFDTKGL